MGGTGRNWPELAVQPLTWPNAERLGPVGRVAATVPLFDGPSTGRRQPVGIDRCGSAFEVLKGLGDKPYEAENSPVRVGAAGPASSCVQLRPPSDARFLIVVLSIAKIGVAHAGYYTGQAAAGLVGYYADGGSRQRPGRWMSAGGMGATPVGGVVTHDTLSAVLGCTDPGTGQQLGRKVEAGGTYKDRLGIERRRRAWSAFDLTYSPPKSISVAWALADEATRAEIEAAFDESVAAVVDYVQAHAVASRAGTNGVRRVEVPAGATVARFDHLSSRAGNPQLHAHLIVSNRVLCDDGTWRTLDGRLIYRHLMPASLYGAAVLRAELSRRVGWDWDPVGEHLHAEVAGNPGGLAALWSARSREVARHAQRQVRSFEQERRREPTPEERLAIWEEAAVRSRKSKQLEELGVDPHEQWRAEAAALGVDADRQSRVYATAPRAGPGRYSRPELHVSARPLPSPALVSHVVAVAEQQANGLTDVGLGKVLYAAVTASRRLEGGDMSGRELVDRTVGALRSQVTDRLVYSDGRWYSPGMISAEVAAVSWLTAPPETSGPPVLVDTGGLGNDQAAAVTRLVAASTTGVAVVGPAGTGKTTMLGRFVNTVGPDRVLAVAPTAVAAATLAAAVGVAGDTVAKVVLEPGRVPHRGWVIVDEAGQVATRELAALCGAAARAQARMVLVGDPAQQGSITAGGLFAALADGGRVEVVTLSELWRFDDPAEAAATAGIRAGNMAALDYHRQRGRVADGGRVDVGGFAADWWQERPDELTAISAPSRDLAHEINVEIATRRRAAGETGEAVAGEGLDMIRVGDVITTRRNHRRLVADDGQWVRNGDRWVVLGSRPGGALTAERGDGSARVVLPEAYVAAHVDLGYAVTHTRAQSISVDAALTVVGPGSRRNQLYVGLTRGRRENHLLVVTDNLAGDEQVPGEHRDADDVLREVFARRHDWSLSVHPDQVRVPAAAAAAHLARVAATPHTEPLPHLVGLDAAELLADTTARTLMAGDLAEAAVGEAIEDWLSDYDDLGYDPYDDDEQRVSEERLLEALGVGASPTVEDPPAGSLSERIRDVLGLDADWDQQYDAYDRLAADWSRTVASTPAGPAVDNPWLVAAVGDYQAVDPIDATRAAALIAAVADPPLRRHLSGYTTEPLSAADQAWAAQVRHAVRHRRAVRLVEHLDRLEALRVSKRRRAERAVADRPGWSEYPPGTITHHDQAVWAVHVLDWLDNGAVPADLPDADRATDRALTKLVSGGAQPLQTDQPPPWQQITAHRPDPPPIRPPNPAVRRTPAQPTPPPPSDEHAHLRAACTTAAGFYHDQLLHSPTAERARRYLEDRGIGPDDWARWQLGWAPNRWQTICHRVGLDLAYAAGLAGRGRGRTYDVLRGRIVFPISDPQGIVAFAGRSLNPDAPAKYLNTRATSIYNKAEVLYGLGHAAGSIHKSGQAGLVEGYTDVIAAHRAGLTHVVGAGGTAFTDHHAARLTQLGADQLTIAFDGDQPGRAAAEKTTQTAADHNIAVRLVSLPVRLVSLPDRTDPADLTAHQLRAAWARALPQPWVTLHHEIVALHYSYHQPHRETGARTRAHRRVTEHGAPDPILALVARHQTDAAFDYHHLTRTDPPTTADADLTAHQHQLLAHLTAAWRQPNQNRLLLTLQDTLGLRGAPPRPLLLDLAAHLNQAGIRAAHPTRNRQIGGLATSCRAGFGI